MPNCKFHVYLGGPVQNTNLYYIHTKGTLIENSIKIQKGVYWGGDFAQIKEMIDANLILKNEIRFFLGYSGWSTGQLDQEIEQESWLVNENPTTDLILKSNQGNKFWIKLTKQMGKFSVLANFPVDPNYN
jgi:putative transcriptional regulator